MKCSTCGRESRGVLGSNPEWHQCNACGKVSHRKLSAKIQVAKAATTCLEALREIRDNNQAGWDAWSLEPEFAAVLDIWPILKELQKYSPLQST